jgi:hypothetical protein
MAGRKKISEISRVRNAAGRLYQKKIKLDGMSHIDIDSNHIQLVESSKRNGRPPVPLIKQRQRAEEKWNNALKEVRILESELKIESMPEHEIILLGKVVTGRKKANGEIERLKKTIRRYKINLDKLQNEIDCGLPEIVDEQLLGRTALTRKEKKSIYEDRINKANQCIFELESEKDPVDIAFLKLNDTRIELRQLNLFINKPDNHQVKNIKITNDDALKRIEFLKELQEKQHSQWMELKKQNNHL